MAGVDENWRLSRQNWHRLDKPGHHLSQVPKYRGDSRYNQVGHLIQFMESFQAELDKREEISLRLLVWIDRNTH